MVEGPGKKWGAVFFFRPTPFAPTKNKTGGIFFWGGGRAKKKKRKLQLEREDECEETSPHNGQGNEPAPRQCAQRAWLHGGRVDSDGGVGQRCVGRRRAQEGRSVRGWCWLPGALILGAACAGLRHHHRDTGGAPAPECRPSGVGSLLLPAVRLGSGAAWQSSIRVLQATAAACDMHMDMDMHICSSYC